jgi:hypothetical protein
MTLQAFIDYFKELTTKAQSSELLELYAKNWTLSFNGKQIEIPFDAVSYKAFIEALEIINELS